jgi:hypothetical protein
MSKKLFSLCLMAFMVSSCGKKAVTKTKIIQVPQVETIQVPVTVPGTTTVVQVPQIIIIDKGFGIKTFPRPISEASDLIKGYGEAVAKVMSINGASGTGFFISEDGLFITNEHVIPSTDCKVDACPGYKLVRDFHEKGANETFTDFDVLAHSDSNGELDFTLLKVKLKDGKKVPYLELELDKAEYNFSNTNLKSYKAVGHPGGASLRFTNVKPYRQKRFNIELLGLLIPGNSGGPLIDESTGKVIGIVKQTRTAFIKEDAESSSHQTIARATSMLDIFRNLKVQELLPEVITKINSHRFELEELKKNDLQEIILPAKSFGSPSRVIFLGALRKKSDDYSSMRALKEIDKFIGTPQEAEALDLMFEKSDLLKDELNIRSLSSLFNKQIKLGRELKISDTNLRSISSELLNENELSGEKLTLAILKNFFNPKERNQLQQKCRDAFPAYSVIFQTIIYSCVTTVTNQGSSMIPAVVEEMKAKTYSDVDDFGSVNGFGMFVGVPGVTDTKDKEALLDLTKFLDKKNKDIESLVQSDTFFMNAILRVSGPGSFSNTMPN